MFSIFISLILKHRWDFVRIKKCSTKTQNVSMYTAKCKSIRNIKHNIIITKYNLNISNINNTIHNIDIPSDDKTLHKILKCSIKQCFSDSV